MQNKLQITNDLTQRAVFTPGAPAWQACRAKAVALGVGGRGTSAAERLRMPAVN